MPIRRGALAPTGMEVDGATAICVILLVAIENRPTILSRKPRPRITTVGGSEWVLVRGAWSGGDLQPDLRGRLPTDSGVDLCHLHLRRYPHGLLEDIEPFLDIRVGCG